MNSDPLDGLLSQYAKTPTPPFAGGNSELWREIERRKARSFFSRLLPLLEWRDLFGEPRLAATGVLLAVAVGMIPAFLARPHRASDERLARESLHFEVFSAQAGDVFAEKSPSQKS